MNDVTIITPPDVLLNDSYAILLINPSAQIRLRVQEILSTVNYPINVFLYDGTEPDIAWLLTILKQVDLTIFDIDGSEYDLKYFATYIIANPKTFYLTNDNVTPYNLISKNRIYDLSWIEHLLKRGNNE